jgi:hypothetical protein
MLTVVILVFLWKAYWDWPVDDCRIADDGRQGYFVLRQTRKLLWMARAEIDDEDRDSRHRLLENHGTSQDNEMSVETLNTCV